MSINFHFRRKLLTKHFEASPGRPVNPCFRPSAGASKADLAEFHAEDMRLRRAEQSKRVRNVGHRSWRRNDDPEWRNREFNR